MNGLFAFIKKEFKENTCNYRLMIMLSIFTLFGFMNPLTAKFTPQLLAMLAPEFGINLPEPKALDSWIQFYKNVSSLGFSLVIILFSTIMSTEYTKGTLIIMLTKGLSRPAVILSKFIVMLCIMTISLLLCFGITYGYTVYFWQDAIFDNLVIAALFLWIGGIFYIALLTLGSVITKGAFASIVLVLLTTAIFSLLGLTPFFSKFNPMQLTTKNIELINGTLKTSEMLLPMLLSLSLSAICVYTAIIIFNKKKL